MNKTHYFCDRCNKEVAGSNVLTSVKIELNTYSSFKGNKFYPIYKYFDLCEECTEKLGFTLRKIVAEKPVVEPTTAEKLYDIIAQMIQENQQ